MRRDTLDIKTTFTVDGAEAVEAAARRTPPSAAVFFDAIVGPDGRDCPHLSDLGWLRHLLRAAQNPGAFAALHGDSDDPDATFLMLQSVEDLYRRLAALTEERPDIYDSERSV
ncbi:hypothetical protein MKK88_28480 [Methylobacterium sp. E-005]|uniref:hypothetical protein n=1 Tax=Methylobacterium sp. E-005 TaxID=2836549 RepID=UPI001FB9AAF7|nr:hypothetical protein [Methylobacterium sp. E-005]MCJ2089895.1 hypothetical protein [Methylobacterium sp. E-005]